MVVAAGLSVAGLEKLDMQLVHRANPKRPLA
nr:MAG TPA: hypothetical protein [Bacteriophage sp.]